MSTNKQKVLVIVGPTASGKTALAIKLAKDFNGEIISADSRQVYQGLDIGTGKVTMEEMGGIPHHLLDVVNPTDTYTAADFVHDGKRAVEEIIVRCKLPIIAGGTFFFVDALLGKNLLPEVPPNPKLRAELEKMDTEALFTLLQEKDPERASSVDSRNRRRLIRSLEIIGTLGSVPKQQQDETYDALTLGIEIDKETLRQNIHARLVARVEGGMLEEVQNLHQNGLSYERLDALGLEYRYVSQYLQGKLTRKELITVLDAKIWQYAKRQMTWLKRDKSIVWIDVEDYKSIYEKVSTFLMPV